MEIADQPSARPFSPSSQGMDAKRPTFAPEQRLPLCDVVQASFRHSCDVATWPGEIGDGPLFHGIICNVHYDGDTGSCLLSRTDPRGAADDDIDLEPGQLGRKFGKPIGAVARPPVLDGDVLVLNPAALVETFPERIERGREAGLRGTHIKGTDPRRPGRSA